MVNDQDVLVRYEKAEACEAAGKEEMAMKLYEESPISTSMELGQPTVEDWQKKRSPCDLP